MSIFSPELATPALPDPRAYGPGKRYFLVNEEQLRQLIIDFSPDIHRDVNRMEDLIHAIIATEREKAGLDKPDGKATLELNTLKRSDGDCDYIGKIRIAGRMYNARAWIAPKAQFINITFDSTL
jgi:hypothetical protein